MCLYPLYGYIKSSFLSCKRASFGNHPTHFTSVSSFFLNCTITVSLSGKNGPTELYFAHFLSEDPSIAVFSAKQNAQIPLSQRRSIARQRCSSASTWLPVLTRLAWRQSARITITTEEGKWEYRLPGRAVKWWSREHGVLLLNQQALYKSCIEQEGRRGEKGAGRKKMEEREEMEEILLGG